MLYENVGNPAAKQENDWGSQPKTGFYRGLSTRQCMLSEWKYVCLNQLLARPVCQLKQTRNLKDQRTTSSGLYSLIFWIEISSSAFLVGVSAYANCLTTSRCCVINRDGEYTSHQEWSKNIISLNSVYGHKKNQALSGKNRTNHYPGNNN